MLDSNSQEEFMQGKKIIENSKYMAIRRFLDGIRQNMY